MRSSCSRLWQVQLLKSVLRGEVSKHALEGGRSRLVRPGPKCKTNELHRFGDATNQWPVQFDAWVKRLTQGSMMLCPWGERFEFDIVDPVEPYPSSTEGIENLIPSPHPATLRSVEHV